MSAELSYPELRAYLEYFRDLGVYDFYRDPNAAPVVLPRALPSQLAQPIIPSPITAPPSADPLARMPAEATVHPDNHAQLRPLPAERAAPPQELDIPKPVPFNDLDPLPILRVPPPEHAGALQGLRDFIGDCTRCPLAYAGRRNIVFGDGDPNAKLMFIGEGPGADEDETGLPFVGKSGQLLNNMIGAMGLTREQVYIANIVKCRPPANRAPEFLEASTCEQFLVRQMDIVGPQYVVALGSTAAQYVLGVKASLASLRGRWHDVRGAKAIITYHPAFLLRDPRQKGEAWKDLQMVMAAMGLKGAGK